jgi:hypothetical protein
MKSDILKVGTLTLISGGLLAMVGCVNVSAQTMLPDMSVQPKAKGTDCAWYAVLPIFIGDTTVAQAMQNVGYSVPNPGYAEKFIRTPITKIHSVTVRDFAVPFYGERCVEVAGE